MKLEADIPENLKDILKRHFYEMVEAEIHQTLSTSKSQENL